MLRVQWGSLRRRRLHRLSSETYMWTAIGGSTAAVAPRGAVAGVLTGLDSNRTWTPAACVFGSQSHRNPLDHELGLRGNPAGVGDQPAGDAAGRVTGLSKVCDLPLHRSTGTPNGSLGIVTCTHEADHGMQQEEAGPEVEAEAEAEAEPEAEAEAEPAAEADAEPIEPMEDAAAEPMEDAAAEPMEEADAEPMEEAAAEPAATEAVEEPAAVTEEAAAPTEEAAPTGVEAAMEDAPKEEAAVEVAVEEVKEDAEVREARLKKEKEEDEAEDTEPSECEQMEVSGTVCAGRGIHCAAEAERRLRRVRERACVCACVCESAYRSVLTH